MTDAVISLTDVSKVFARDGWLRRDPAPIRAVEGVTLSIGRGETLAIVGESGCGKSTLGRLVLCLERPTVGTVEWSGEPVSDLPERVRRKRRATVQAVFQDPYLALNGRLTVLEIIAEPLRNLGIADRAGAYDRAIHSLEAVGLDASQGRLRPHAFSGGQRQRIAIARALAPAPQVVVCDEAVSALDVSVQAQILNLLRRLQDSTNCSYLFISHDLGVVRQVATRVAVMYLGRIVEVASAAQFYAAPAHPYARSLLDAVPVADPARRRLRHPPVGEAPSPRFLPEGCAFHPRCPRAEQRCRQERPRLRNVGSYRSVACHFPQ